MSKRVLSRKGARELTREEMLKVHGAHTGCQSTLTLFPRGDTDFICDPA
jgi:hypothetical protein